jgi:hypothetical protein
MQKDRGMTGCGGAGINSNFKSAIFADGPLIRAYNVCCICLRPMRFHIYDGQYSSRYRLSTVNILCPLHRESTEFGSCRIDKSNYSCET